MNISADRGSPGEPIKLTIWLENAEAAKLIATLRELTGDAKPPRKPETWKPLTFDVTAAAAPKPPPAVREEIAKKLGRRRGLDTPAARG